MARRFSDMSHHRPRLAGGVMLATRAACAAMLNRHPDLVSRYVQPIACDTATRLALYDADEVARIVRAKRRRVA